MLSVKRNYEVVVGGYSAQTRGCETKNAEIRHPLDYGAPRLAGLGLLKIVPSGDQTQHPVFSHLRGARLSHEDLLDNDRL
jgi:hypothetical protein